MMDIKHWTCPYCNHDATLREQDIVSGTADFDIQDPAEGHKRLVWCYTVCPNYRCRKFTLSVVLFDLDFDPQTGNRRVTGLANTWNLVPRSRAKAFPDYIPKSILDDYNEACLIANLSPKASATLARRCLQGIIRDFWKANPGRLVDEIDQIKNKTDQLTWDAIQAVRKVGNIGAHMEKDINLILEVDPQEARMLIELIEILLKDWYVTREERKKRLLSIKSVADKKEGQKSTDA